MRRLKLPNKAARNTIIAAALAVLIFASLYNLLATAYGAHLGNRSLTLSDSTAAATNVTYNFNFVITTPGTLGSVLIQFCANDPIVGDVCQVPTGFSDSTAVLDTQTGETGFSIDPSSTANTLVLTRTAAPDTAGNVNFVFTGVTNPPSPGSYFARIQTYASTDTSGSSSDYGGIAFAINSAINITATVPPYLLFCTGVTIPGNNCANATGDYINFGELSPTTASIGTSQMLTATNAGSGYAITVYGTTLESGNNVINAISTPDVSRPGTAQFGLNLMANSSPPGGSDPGGYGNGQPTTDYGTPNFYKFNSGDIVASYYKPDQDRLYTDSYIVNIPATQVAGVYATTLTYICVATF